MIIVGSLAGISVGKMFIAGALPGPSRRLALELRERPGMTALLGFLALTAIPVAAVMLMVTIIGFPIAVLAMVLYAALLMVGYVWLAVVLGGLLLDRLDKQDAAAILQHLNASTAMMAVTQIRVLGGAVARVPVEATAYAHRQRRIMLNLACLYADLAQTAEHTAWVEAFAADLSRGQNPGAYVNFVGAEGPRQLSAISPPATAARLAALKARYDPTNLFRFNHNLAPAAQ